MNRWTVDVLFLDFQDTEAVIDPQSAHTDGDPASVLSTHRQVTDHGGTAPGGTLLGLQSTHRGPHKLGRKDQLFSIPPW